MKKIEEICDVIAGQSPPSESYNKIGEGLPFFQGKTDFGDFYPIVRSWCTNPTKIALPNDILLSVRAPVGPVNIANQKCCIGRGLSAIRAKTNCDHKFIFYFFKFYEPLLSNQGSGSTFSAVTQSIVRDIPINLPPLPEQQRIVALLDKADSLRQKRRQAIALLDEFLKSTFLDMFGDPVKNEKGWENKTLCDVGKLDRGKSKHRPRNAPELLGGPYPLIQTGDIANSNGYIKYFKSSYSEVGLKQSKLWPKGTLCITIAANIAKTGILTFEACFPDSVVGFVPNSLVNNEYIQMWMSFLQKTLEETAPESAQKNINLDILRKLKIPTPPISLQNKFAAIVEKTEQAKAKMKAQLVEMDNNFNGLMAGVFRG